MDVTLNFSILFMDRLDGNGNTFGDIKSKMHFSWLAKRTSELQGSLVFLARDMYRLYHRSIDA